MRAIGLGAAALLLAVTVPALAQDKTSHLHIAHVLDAWNGTPDGMGLLPTAQAEQHMGFMLKGEGLI